MSGDRFGLVVSHVTSGGSVVHVLAEVFMVPGVAVILMVVAIVGVEIFANVLIVIVNHSIFFARIYMEVLLVPLIRF